ncbi:MAG TPA: bifunctional 2-C-methyl-D-erythritol 4-phosphate cytidylyltransferase/2-C-methyl-D-erythritol 2,4-cyclodiphosphate synthase [Caulobacteraceae bacterium]
MSFTAIVVAAGSGTRSGGPKQWRPLGGKPVVRWSVEAFAAAGAAEIIVVVPPGETATAQSALNGVEGVRLVEGGASRSQSVRNGLAAIGDSALPVLVHDAARPLVTLEHVGRLLEAIADSDAALPLLPVADTVKRASAGRVDATVPRDGLFRAQTPQAFAAGVLQAAWDRWASAEEPTDDVAVVEASGGRVMGVPGDPRLMKLTFPEDFAMAEALIAAARTTRIGQGFDAHRWGPGASVWLCGVEIAHAETLIGHSDADAGLHALTDAVLGAIGAGDIGEHFPPSDPRWKGASSDRFLAHAVALAAERGARVVNADVTLICEAPRIKPHRDAMRARVAELLGVPLDRVSVKATTTEGMGFTGRGEGLAAQAIVTVDAPA